MTEALLTTKLFIPSTRRDLVPRPRLIQQLNEGLHRKLTLISAPAGFGKTTLVTEWLDNLRLDAKKETQVENRIAWLSLDKGDNDPVRFLSYFIAALNQVEGKDATFGKGALSMLQSPQPPPTEAILTSLINEFAEITDKYILVLDDYHLIEAKPIHDALTFFIEHLPTQMHLVFATREDPQLSLARLRSQGHLTELRAIDLRFTSSEITEFLNQMMGLNLSAEDIATLETRTEGWIAGLQLAAISLHGRENATNFIKAFTGSHRLILDYLTEEVLNQQTENIKSFLLKTAVLNRLTGSLCDELTGQDNGQAILEQLDHNNLFIVPLDNERRWYRYHHLFADLLQQRLRQSQPYQESKLHSLASVWFEKNRFMDEAIDHALNADDLERMVHLIENSSLEALERSELRFILKWVDLLPDNALKSSPWLYIYHCWALVLTGQAESVSSRLENIEWLMCIIEEKDETRQQEMLGFIAGLKSMLAIWKHDLITGLDFANQALEYLPKNNWIRGYCAIVMGASFLRNGNLNAAKDAYAESYSIGKASGNIMVGITGACNLAFVLELKGRIQQAVQLFQDSFQFIEQDGKVLPVMGYIYVDLARILYELNDLNAASQHLTEGIELCQRLADGRAEKIGFGLLARVQLAQGKYANVLDSIQKVDDADPSPGTQFELRGGEYPRIRFWLKEKKLKDLEAWVKENGVNVDEVLFFSTKLTYSMHARVLIALGREHPDDTYLIDALDLLEELLEMAENNGWGSKVIEILALRALALQTQGDTEGALATLERALTLGEPEGFIRTFVDEGLPMEALLKRMKVEDNRMKEYIRKLLSAFSDKDSLPSSVSSQPLIEPLSEREIEVLQLIAEGLSNQEIASRLFLSLNTIKVHTRNIYGKLGTNNRTQAVAKAKELEILSLS